MAFGQRYCRSAIINQHDMVGGKREFVAAARSVAVDCADVDLLRVFRSVLDCKTRFVCELAEVHLGAMSRLSEHADIGASAEYIVLAGLDHDAAHFRMFKAQALHRVVQFDVDAEIIRIELELVIAEAARLIDIHDEIRDVPVALDFQWR